MCKIGSRNYWLILRRKLGGRRGSRELRLTPLTENETLLEQIDKKMRSGKSDSEAASAKDDQQQKSERKKATAIRHAASKTWS